MKLNNAISLYLTVAVLMFTGCGDSNSKLLNEDAILESTQDALELSWYKVDGMVLSKVSKLAIKGIAPAADVRLELSGAGKATITASVGEMKVLPRYLDQSALGEVRDAINTYNIIPEEVGSLPEISQAGHIVRYVEGQEILIEWEREVTFFNNPKTGKLDLKYGRVQITSDFDTADVTTELVGVDIGDEAQMAVENEKIRTIRNYVIKAGKEEMAGALSGIATQLSEDFYVTDGDGNLFLIELPEELKTLEGAIPDGVMRAKMHWVDSALNIIFTVPFEIEAKRFEKTSEYKLDLWGYVQAPKVYPKPELPYAFKGTSLRLQVLKASFTLDWKGAEFLATRSNCVTVSKINTEIAQQLIDEKAAMKRIETKQFRCAMESRKGIAYPIDFIVVRNPSGETLGKVITQSLETGDRVEWEIESINTYRSKGSYADPRVKYSATRIGERARSGHDFERDSSLRLTVYTETGKVEVVDFEKSAVALSK